MKTATALVGKTDRIGHPVTIGSRVYFSPAHYKHCILGKIVKMSEIMCMIEHEHPNINGYTTTTKQNYGQIFLDTANWVPTPPSEVEQQIAFYVRQIELARQSGQTHVYTNQDARRAAMDHFIALGYAITRLGLIFEIKW